MWGQKQIKEQIEVVNGNRAPDIVLQNATYLHSIYKQWKQGHIWIAGDRIVYVGDQLPKKTDGTEIVDVLNKKVVPGYIEPHVHPFQLYHAESYGEFAGRLGTTTFLADNLIFYLLLEKKLAFQFMEQLKQLPIHYYWWARFDAQTILPNDEQLFHPDNVKEWLQREDVRMGGELTGWPRLLRGDKQMFQNIFYAKQAGVKVEGHLPGASEHTLVRMKLLGIDGDHESMTVEEVEKRLLHGYAVTLRHSSIRPDLLHLLQEIVQRQLPVFDHLMMTTDGSTPAFYLDGVMDQCIQIALDAQVEPIDAYQMASYNIARYYGLDDVLGQVATGRYATLNLLENERQPRPIDVLSKGVWLTKQRQPLHRFRQVDWSKMPDFSPSFNLEAADFEFPTDVGIEMINDVITKPYQVTINLHVDQLDESHDECFFMLIDRHGKWRVNTILKGFATGVHALASSYSNTGDILLIGKRKDAMHRAFQILKEIKGGIVLVENEQLIASIPLPIGGAFSAEPMERLIEQEQNLKEQLAARGYRFGDAVYTLLFLMSTHLPYVRITRSGLYQVKERQQLIPVVEREGMK